MSYDPNEGVESFDAAQFYGERPDPEILEAFASYLASCPRDEPLDAGAQVMLRQIFERIDEYTEAAREMAKRLEVGGG